MHSWLKWINFLIFLGSSGVFSASMICRNYITCYCLDIVLGSEHLRFSLCFYSSACVV